MTLQEIKNKIISDNLSGLTYFLNPDEFSFYIDVIGQCMDRYATRYAKEALNNAHQSCLEGSSEGPEAALESILSESNLPKHN